MIKIDARIKLHCNWKTVTLVYGGGDAYNSRRYKYYKKLKKYFLKYWFMVYVSLVFNKWPLVLQILQSVHLLYVPMGQAEFNNWPVGPIGTYTEVQYFSYHLLFRY